MKKHLILPYLLVSNAAFICDINHLRGVIYVIENDAKNKDFRIII